MSRPTKGNRDWTGMKFGDIRILREAGRDSRSKLLVECRCERVKHDGTVCGKVFTTMAQSVTRGLTKSCGCLRSERTKKWWTKLERRLKHRYFNILHRCYNPSDVYYNNYGGRGITVCEEWLHDKDAFIRYCVEHGARLDLDIDRIDNDGPYAPGNIRFVTRRENTLNRRCTRYVKFGDSEIPLTEVARKMGVRYQTAECWNRRGVLQSRIADFLAGRQVFKKGGRIPKSRIQSAA